MDRDLDIFPKDSIGDSLWQINETAEDLNIIREVEFSVLFPSQTLALQFGQILLENSQKLSCTPFQENEALPWEITAYPEMQLSYENIMAYKELLESNSSSLQGVFDGFYCL